jgi:hypothetical protein
MCLWLCPASLMSDARSRLSPSSPLRSCPWASISTAQVPRALRHMAKDWSTSPRYLVQIRLRRWLLLLSRPRAVPPISRLYTPTPRGYSHHFVTFALLDIVVLQTSMSAFAPNSCVCKTCKSRLQPSPDSIRGFAQNRIVCASSVMTSRTVVSPRNRNNIVLGFIR